MGKRKKTAPQAAAAPFDLPIADEGAITETTVYPTIEAMFTECIASKPWYQQHSPGTQRTIKYAFYTAIAEALRTVSFRANSEQNFSVFDDFGRELRAYDLELQRAAGQADTELH
jgi:hypothetical protein